MQNFTRIYIPDVNYSTVMKLIADSKMSVVEENCFGDNRRIIVVSGNMMRSIRKKILRYVFFVVRRPRNIFEVVINSAKFFDFEKDHVDLFCDADYEVESFGRQSEGLAVLRLPFSILKKKYSECELYNLLSLVAIAPQSANE